MNIQNFSEAVPLEYIFPHSVDAAVRALAEWHGQARIIAGGTDLLPALAENTLRPRCLISTARIHGLDEIRLTDEYVEIGAAVTFADLKEYAYINQSVEVLAGAARSVGALAIQNVATLAGNIVNAMPAADGSMAAIALEAEAQVVDSAGAKWIAVETLFRGPGQSALDPARQLLTHIRFRRYERGWGTAWYRLGRRPSLTLPILNCALSLRLDESGQQILHAVIAVGPVAPQPFRARQAERFLDEHPISAENLQLAAEIVPQECSPRGNLLRASKEYRQAMLPVLVKDALQQALRRASFSSLL
jgi:carbon-monoxide dehydrogenase medium subunit